MNGDLEEAEKKLRTWKQGSQELQEEVTRWKAASLALNLHMMRKRNPEATLTSADEKSGELLQVDLKQVEETCRGAQKTGYLWLFDKVDQDLVQHIRAWKPTSHDQFGAWQ